MLRCSLPSNSPIFGDIWGVFLVYWGQDASDISWQRPGMHFVQVSPTKHDLALEQPEVEDRCLNQAYHFL